MKKYTIFIGVLFFIIWMLVIFYFSSKSNAQIKTDSSGIVKILIQIIEGKKFDSYSLEKQKELIKKYTYFLSKLGHFLEYGILCFFCFLIFHRLKKYHIRYIICLLLCGIYAITDEFHQIFSDGRSPRVQDVFIDLFGALAMILFIEWIITIKRMIKDR